MTFHTQVVGANGQRQAMFIERHAGPRRGHPVELPVRPARRDDRVLGERPDGRPRGDGRGREGAAACGSSRSRRSPSRCPPSRSRPPGSRLLEVADLVLDLCSPDADATVTHRRPRHAGGPRVHDRRGRHRQRHQGPDRRAPRGARGHAARHHPRERGGHRAVAGAVRRSLSRACAAARPCDRPARRWVTPRPARDTHGVVNGGPRPHHGAPAATRRRTQRMKQSGQGPGLVAIGAIALVVAACAAGRPLRPRRRPPRGSGSAAPASEARPARPQPAVSGRSATRTPAASATASARSRSAPRKAEALASGKVGGELDDDPPEHRRGRQQLQDIRDLIANGRRTRSCSTRTIPTR